MTALIGIDWGSTALRAFRFSGAGAVIETRTSARGVATITDGDFATVFATTVNGWASRDTPILMAGMIGSRGGWHEARYLPCPADPGALAGALLPIATPIGRGAIVPGLSVDAPADVMRGEETQLLGAGVRDGMVVLPGTHCKWARLSGGRITGFRTTMTGELYAVLLAHSVLGRLVEPSTGSDGAAFDHGVHRSIADPALLATLFSARAEVLLGSLRGVDIAEYLSGLLIGAEIAAMAPAGPLILVGDPALCDRYRRAAALAGVSGVTAIAGDVAAAAGLWQIGQDWLGAA